MSTVDGKFCSVTDCVSLTTNGTETQVATLETAIQIRWAESDLPILATHPLTPGLKFTSAASDSVAETGRPAASPRRYHGVPKPQMRLQIGIGLSFLPLLLSIAFAFVGAFAFRGRATESKLHPSFTPLVLRWHVLTLLLGLTLTLIPLLDMAVRGLPRSAGSSQVPIDRSINKVHIEHVVMLAKPLETTTTESGTDCNPNFSTSSRVTQYVVNVSFTPIYRSCH